MTSDCTVVWFKRDLRVHDHLPLADAAQRGPVLCLYILEPSLWAQPDAARQHLAFLRECLRDLHHELAALGATLELAVGEVVDVLTRLHASQPFRWLVSHEETGNAHTYARDRAVGAWCRRQGVAWQEWRQHGVVRRLRSRDAWAAHWQAHMDAPCVPTPSALVSLRLPWRDRWPHPDTFGLDPHEPPARQRGGRGPGTQVLHSFLHQRCQAYRGGMSSPLTAPDACSRLSPYLAWGCLSLREVVQATQHRLQHLELSSGSAVAARQRQGLAAFVSRLHWHCHFIQKLESEPEIEHHNMHRGYDGLREADAQAGHLAALQAGRTGWPLVDACVAMLRETGWLNFRMRAMLVSVAAFPLWLHWRPVGLWLARQFLDYEPGIHWSQLQMQSGTTGMNTVRVYNPIKQAQDHDPHGHFVRRWLPALRRVPDTWLFEPWRMPPDVQKRCGVQVGQDIPEPLVDLAVATRHAKARLYAVRAQPEVRAATAAVVRQHASQRRPSTPPRRRQRPESGPLPRQQTLDF